MCTRTFEVHEKLYVGVNKDELFEGEGTDNVLAMISSHSIGT
jgi:hypothetical protein